MAALRGVTFKQARKLMLGYRASKREAATARRGSA